MEFRLILNKNRLTHKNRTHTHVYKVSSKKMKIAIWGKPHTKKVATIYIPDKTHFYFNIQTKIINILQYLKHKTLFALLLNAFCLNYLEYCSLRFTMPQPKENTTGNPIHIALINIIQQNHVSIVIIGKHRTLRKTLIRRLYYAAN